jgi:ATP-binding cassette subfamily B protein
LSLLLERRVTSRLYEFFYKETPEEREREYLGDLLIQPRNTKEIRAYVIADYLLGRHEKISEDLYAQRKRMYRSGTRISALTGLVAGITLALAYAFVAFRGVAGEIDPGGIVLVIGAFTSVSGTLAQFQAHSSQWTNTPLLGDYFSFLSIGPIACGSHPAPLPSRARPCRIPNVTFSYPGETGRLYRGSIFQLRWLMALVGENGAGKSTFVKLPLRFYWERGRYKWVV